MPSAPDVQRWTRCYRLTAMFAKAAGDGRADRAALWAAPKLTSQPHWGLGATVTERWVPVERVACTCWGNAVYPSSVVMNVVPAGAAGVDSLVVAVNAGAVG